MHVGPEELPGAQQGAVDVRLGGEVHHDLRVAHEGGGDGGVRDVAVDEAVPWIRVEILQILPPAA